MDNAKVIRPGDADHPAEQARAAGERTDSAFASYAARVTIHGLDPDDAPTIAAFEEAVSAAIGDLLPAGSFSVNVDATRTDR